MNNLILSALYRVLAFYVIIAILYYQSSIPKWIAYVLLTLSSLYILMFMYVFFAFTSEVASEVTKRSRWTVVLVLTSCVALLVLDFKLMQLFRSRGR